jgi:hypothetical protein
MTFADFKFSNPELAEMDPFERDRIWFSRDFNDGLQPPPERPFPPPLLKSAVACSQCGAACLPADNKVLALAACLAGDWSIYGTKGRPIGTPFALSALVDCAEVEIICPNCIGEFES